VKRSNLALILMALCLAAGSVTAAAAQSRTLVIRDVSAFDGERLIRRATVVVHDGRIVSIGTRARTPGDAEVVNAAGMTLLPGLIDAHTHETEGRPPLRQALMLG
jgi:imidazolonepropionase-like amidohydrolase